MLSIVLNPVNSTFEVVCLVVQNSKFLEVVASKLNISAEDDPKLKEFFVSTEVLSSENKSGFSDVTFGLVETLDVCGLLMCVLLMFVSLG